MVFSSAIFLFIFFPAVFIIYRIIPTIKAKNVFLAVSSLIFFAFGQLEYIFLLLFSVTVNYICGCLLAKSDKNRRFILFIAVFINLGLLCAYKYLGFLIGNLNFLFHAQIPDISVSLPIGISFYTFQGLSYIIDVYRDKKLSTNNYLKLLLYISLFPQLIAGPIIIYHDVAKQIDNRVHTAELTADGLRRFIIGLSKKLLIANTLGQIADTVFNLSAAQLDFRVAWIGALCYTLQIYFDFSGYSDMAIGLGKTFGFSFMENFQYPYTTTGIREFWRKWHISLSSWFRDYLYIPLGGNRKGKLRSALNKCIVFFCTGLWHGASWTFVIWGLWHGLFIILEDFGIIPTKKINRFIGNIYTLLVVILGFVLFRADNMELAGDMISNMFNILKINPTADSVIFKTLNFSNLFIFAVAVIASTKILPTIREKLTEKQPRLFSMLDKLTYCAAALLLLINVLNIASSTFNPFIYFRF